jgi:hypothetical protein
MESLLQMPNVVSLSVAGDQATATTQIVEFAPPKEAPLMICTGFDEDRLVRMPQGWRFKRRELTIQNRTFVGS